MAFALPLIMHHSMFSPLFGSFFYQESSECLTVPYSPGMTLCDYIVFLRLKLLPDGHRFQTITAIQMNLLAALKALRKSGYMYIINASNSGRNYQINVFK